MLQRLLGIITFKAPVYREIADDSTATKTAAGILIVVAFIQGLSARYPGQEDFWLPFALGSAIFSVIMGLIGWVIVGWILSTVAGWFGGKTNTGEMLRVTGFTSVFGLISIFSLLTFLSPALAYMTAPLVFISIVLSIVGNVIGVREAAEFATDKAIGTSIIGGVVGFIISLVGSLISVGVLGLYVMAAGG